MQAYRHHVLGFYVRRSDAESALARLVQEGFSPSQMQIYENEPPALTTTPHAGSKLVLKDVLVDGAVGTVIGTGLGALGELALVAANVSLFIASPLVAPLFMLGWGAGVGGMLGAAIGAANTERPFTDMVRDALDNGQIVLVVETHSENESALARGVVEASIKEYDDVK
ncbi:hypothetical protein CAP31_09725 [Sulfuriferula sp. AH1]|uniref:hypothetical protein n=1 Tax=Sulfuriferula sp. AH1 TaxID=1985873 RepID=UPI000B3B43AA|nr:hypothetical protein [Sulfuriferula sp. AH1]ARU31931.1 hypothetical protein CAP31_09725 [Sulfuriferula sp. AH1]